MADQAEMQSPEERMTALLGAEETEPEEQEVQEEAEQEESEELEDSEEEEQPESDEEFVLSWNGETVRKSREEVVTLAQQGFDYTQKTQALADARKTFDQEKVNAQEVINMQAQMNQLLANHIGEVKAYELQLAEWEKVDWEVLIEADPQQALKADHQYRALQGKYNKANNDLNAAAEQMQMQTQQQRNELISHQMEELLNKVPEWKDSSKASIEKEELRGFLGKEGFSDNEINGVVDHRAILLARKAMLYDKLMQSKPGIEKRVSQAPKVAKPGVMQNNKSRMNRDLRQKLRDTGSDEYATKLIESLL